MFRSRLSVIALLVPLSLGASMAQKKPLDPSVYDNWKSIRGTALSRDGRWVLYTISPQEGDSTEVIKDLNSGAVTELPRGLGFRFSSDSKFAVGMISPPFLEVRAAKRKKAKPDDLPKSSLEIVNLESGVKTVVERVSGFFLGADDKGWLAYKKEPEPSKDPKTPVAPADKKPGVPLVVRNLGTGKEETIPLVNLVSVAKKGTAIAFSTTKADGKGDKVQVLDFESDKKTDLSQVSGEFPQVTVSEDGQAVAFEFRPEKKTNPAKTDKSKEDAKPPEPPAPVQLYLWEAKVSKTARIGEAELHAGWVISDKTAPTFSEKGLRLLYRTQPAPPMPQKEVPDDEKVSLDVWTWQDPKLMPAQILQAEAERSRGYVAIYNMAGHKSIQVCDRSLPEVTISDKEEGRYGVGTVETPYELSGSWDPGYHDLYLVDLEANKRTLLARHVQVMADLSPKGDFVALFDDSAKSWSAVQCATGNRVSLSNGIPNPLFDELTDVPSAAPAYGILGWFDESHPIVSDRFDLWSCDALGKQSPKRLTFGRDRTLRLRPIKLDLDALYLPSDDLLLSGFDESTKQEGVFKLHRGTTSKLIQMEKSFGGFLKSKNADRLVYTREDFVEFPDLWATNLEFGSPTKISDANPQQKDFNWGKAELVQWNSLDGVPLKGILIKPENFDYSKNYPLIAYFYERLSDSLYAYHPPSPSASTINLSYFASNGYCVFVPDIPYRVGYPGYSALSAIVPGVQSIVNRGYIDPKRLGIQGQSWGGYQVAYLVTQTNMFAAAEAGAPVADMFSAYGGIRYGTGVVREMQYEHGQSRIGGTPWDSTLRYIENSPVFFADKIQTPLMIMSNDKDGAVPHTQGIEMFTALRRLNKPSWMVVYNGEDHNIVERKNRKDFGIRLSQFFDHFLKGAPMPVWMEKGLPAVDKGRTMGLELAGPGSGESAKTKG